MNFLFHTGCSEWLCQVSAGWEQGLGREGEGEGEGKGVQLLCEPISVPALPSTGLLTELWPQCESHPWIGGETQVQGSQFWAQCPLQTGALQG